MMKLSQPEEHNKSSSQPIQQVAATGKDEMNLAEFPLTRIGRNDTRQKIEYRGQMVNKAGEVLEQKWTVDGSVSYGLPTEFADRVLVALMAITAKDGFTERKVPFTIYRVLSFLGITCNKRNYSAVERALHQLVGVTIYSEGAFWDKVIQKRVTTKKGFHLLEEFWLKSFETDEAIIEAEGVNGYIVWGERVWDSFKAGYIKQLDTTFYYSLENALSRRLYRFLDKRMHYQDQYQIDIFDLSARIGMKPYPYPSDIVRKLSPALTELQARGYLANIEVLKLGQFTRLKFTRVGATILTQGTLLPLNEVEIVGEQGEIPKVITPNEAALAALYAEYDTSDTLKEIWADILLELKQSMPSASYLAVAPSALLAVQEGTAVIALPGRMIDWAERQLHRKIRSGLSVSLKTKITALTFCALPG